MQKIFTLSLKAWAIPPKESRNWLQLKNVLFTSGQPGDCVITTARTVKNTTVLRSAIATPRRPSPARQLPRTFEAAGFYFAGPARRSPSPATAAGSCWSWPLRFIAASAPLTLPTSGFPWANTMPKC